MKFRKSINLAAALVVIGQQLSFPSFASENLPAECVADLRLKRAVCVSIGFHAPLRNRSSEQILISIDGENLRNCTFEQIKKKLGGPSGTVVNVEFAYPNGDTEVVEIHRAVPKLWQERANQDPIKRIDFNYQPRSSAASNLLEFSSFNTDLIGKLKCIQAEDFCKENPGNDVGIFVKCMLFNHAIGDFEAADEYLKKLLDSIKKNPINPHTGFSERTVVQNLVALGKNAEAEALCKYLLLPGPTNAPRLPAAITVLDAYSLIPSVSAKNASRELAESIVSGKRVQVVTSFPEDWFWLAQYLESIGLHEKALAVYAKEYQNLRKRTTYSGLTGTQYLGFCLYSRARTEAMLGDKVQANKDLEAIEQAYSTLSTKQKSLLDKLPEYFPSYRHIEKARVALASSSPIAAPPKVNSFSNQHSYVNEGAPSYNLHFPLALRCVLSIKENKRLVAEDLASQLVKAYDKSSEFKPYQNIRQNLFCTCLLVARSFADHGWLDSAESLLVKLETAAKNRTPQLSNSNSAWTMIAAERAYNSYLSKPKSNIDWNALKGCVDSSDRQRQPEKFFVHRLRMLAMAYTGAGKMKRAKFFIDSAIQQLKSVNKAKIAPVRPGRAFEGDAILFFDAAYIYAKLGDYRNADNYLDYAFKQQIVVDEKVATLLSMLATIYSENDRSEKAISILERSVGLIPSKYSQMYGPEFEMILAELYRKNGQSGKALVLVKKVLKESRSPAPVKESKLMAELSEEAGNYADAARYYYEAGKWHGSYSKPVREQLLNGAIRCASKVPGFDKSLLSKVYVALAGLPESNEMEKSLVYRKKAVALLEDSDPEKAKQLSVIGYVEGELAKAKLKSDKKQGPSALSESTAYDIRIATARKAAELASKSKSKDESSYWLRLAYAETEAKKFDEAVADARRGIAAYKSENAKAHTAFSFVHSGLALAIANGGYAADAESIMKEALARVSSVAGAGTMPAQAQMSNQFEYFVRRKEYGKAERVLKSFLCTNLNRGHYAPPNHDIHICRFGGPFPIESSMEIIRRFVDTARNSATDKDNRQALRFLNLILRAEESQFGRNDYRVGLTYSNIAQVHFVAGQNQEAYEAFEKAKEIMHKYEGIMWVLSSLGPDYYSVLRKVGKQSEIERMESLKLEEQRQRQLRHMRPRRN